MDTRDPIHPNAPAGGGGPGTFKSAKPLGMHPAFDTWMARSLIALAPAGAAPWLAAAPDTAAHHTVKAGDSLWLIAARQLGDGRLANDLAALNRIAPEAVLRIGQRLIVPDYRRDAVTVDFMCADMLANARGTDAKAIADAVQRSQQLRDTSAQAVADMKKSSWYEVFRLLGNQEILRATTQQSGVAMAEAQGRWFIQVRQGGPWDHKPILRQLYEAMPSPPRPFGTMGKAFHFPVRGDLVHEYYYDVWSNIHYGYVGARCGFDAATLQGGAASGLPGAGDNDLGDVISVDVGIGLWKSAGLGLTANLLRQALVARAADYLAARRSELQRGVSTDQATQVVITDNDYK